MTQDINAISDIGILARTLLGESRGEGKQGMQAVANVIGNRVSHPCWWGDSFRSVCLDPHQFSCWLKSDPNYSKILAWPESDPLYIAAMEIALEAMKGTLLDITHGANSYYAKGIPAPAWARGVSALVTIGHHIFYKL